MNHTKIMLSEMEKDLVMNVEWILTKNGIIRKAWMLLEGVQDEISSWVEKKKNIFPDEVERTSAKISKGENYKGLPYLILDYPRLFEKKNIFAIRCMFWWGNFFSITLQLAGTYQKLYENSLIKSYETLSKYNFYISFGNDQWEHHFESSNYSRIGELSKIEFSNNILAHPFIKIANRIPLEQWDYAQQKLTVYFIQITEMIAS